MADKNTKAKDAAPSEVEAAAENAAAQSDAPAPKALTGAEYDNVVKSYHEGNPQPGYAYNWVTSGGETKLRVTKLG